MDDKRHMLRHFLATLAYRTQKALRDAPGDFPDFCAGSGTRTPHELICHMTNVLGYARSTFLGGTYPYPSTTDDFASDVNAFHDMLGDLSHHLEIGTPLRNTTEEILLQGPFSDAMAHAGQLAMLRRLASSPIRHESFIDADIHPANLGSDQPPPASPDEDWPEQDPEG